MTTSATTSLPPLSHWTLGSIICLLLFLLPFLAIFVIMFNRYRFGVIIHLELGRSNISLSIEAKCKNGSRRCGVEHVLPLEPRELSQYRWMNQGRIYQALEHKRWALSGLNWSWRDDEVPSPLVEGLVELIRGCGISWGGGTSGSTGCSCWG